MSLRNEGKKLLGVALAFVALYFLPMDRARFGNAVLEALALTQWYAREHVLLCLLPAFFIAGAISVFVRQASVMRYLGPGANRVLAYGVASVAGTILAVCSCTVLPLFAGIYRLGAGLGPATAFLYSGPAINVLAIVLTARVLGLELGVARAVGAISFSVVIGLLMAGLYRRQEQQRAQAAALLPAEPPRRTLRQQVLYFACLVGILVFANWARTGDVRVVFLCCPGGLSTYQFEGTQVVRTEGAVVIHDTSGAKHEIPAELVQDVQPIAKNRVYERIFNFKWALVLALLAGLLAMLRGWFDRKELGEWVEASWGFAWQILPLLLGGVVLAGLLLGRPGHEGLIPSVWVNAAVGGNSLRANLLASVLGAFMYFATLTEVPIVQGLLGSGMGKGPALALLLAGPALSLPSMLVIRSILGTQKTIVYVTLVVVMATLTGMFFGLVAR